MVWVGCSFLCCTIFFVFLLCHPVLWYVDGVDHRDTYVSRCSALKNLVTSETADVPPFVLIQIIFCCAGCLVEGCQHPWHGTPPPPGAATANEPCHALWCQLIMLSSLYYQVDKSNVLSGWRLVTMNAVYLWRYFTDEKYGFVDYKRYHLIKLIKKERLNRLHPFNSLICRLGNTTAEKQ